MYKIQNTAAYIFIVAVGILSVISVLGVWDFFSDDVITKSFSTIGLLAVVAVIVMVAGRFIGVGHEQPVDGATVAMPSPVFPAIRKATLSVLIVAVSLLALLGVLAIWELIKDKEVLYRSLSSLGVLAFGAFVMTLTCLEREGKLQRAGKGVSGGAILGTIIIAWMIFAWLRSF